MIHQRAGQIGSSHHNMMFFRQMLQRDDIGGRERVFKGGKMVRQLAIRAFKYRRMGASVLQCCFWSVVDYLVYINIYEQYRIDAMLARLFKRQSIIYLAGFVLVAFVAGKYFYPPNACNTASEGNLSVRVSGLSWDADSSGFAFLQGLSKAEGKKKAGRISSRVYVDGQPERFAITESGPEFQIEFETDQPTFRLIAEGDGFPRAISQPYKVPKAGCDIDVARLNAPRGEGPEHTWPLPMVASKMGYNSWQELMAGNNAVVRLLIYGSGEEGAPDFTDKTIISAQEATLSVHPFDMDKKITFLQLMDENTGGFMLVVPFSAEEPADKKILLKVVDTVTEAKWNPPRPWKFDAATILVRNGFATDIRLSPSADQ